VICDLCIAMGGRFDANRECCQIRMTAALPQHMRLAAFAKVRAEAGRAAEEAFREKVRVEYMRQREHRRAKFATQMEAA
jgi:hypothetical protein